MLVCLFGDNPGPDSEKPTEGGAGDSSAKMEEEELEEEEEEESLPGCTLFIKNLNFTTTEETLKGVSGGSGAGGGAPSARVVPVLILPVNMPCVTA